MNNGWIRLHRKLADDPLWLSEPFTRGQAWADLIMIANYEPSYFYIRGNKIDVDRGQVAWGEVKLAERWQWSRTKVRKYLNDLEKEQQIVQQKSTLISIVTIVKYEEYQKKKQQSGQQKNSRKTAEKHIKEVKEVKEEKEEEVYPPIIPPDIDPETWKAFEEMRAMIKQPMTERAKKNIIAELERLYKTTGQSKNAILNQSITNNWRGVFEIKQNKINGVPLVTKKTEGNWALLREIEEGNLKPLGAE